MVLICGVDEAGRGPVIGPLVICGAVIEEKDEDKLKALKVKDSKLLSKKQREYLFSKIKQALKKYKIVIIEPKEIDKAVFGEDGLNLNWLEARKTAEIINELNPDKVIVDSPSNNIKAYRDYLKGYTTDKGVEIIAEHKADLNYPIVSAASILAKVTRDNEIEKIKISIGVDFGSGYPSDPLTQDFLKKNYEKYPKIFRKSWSSYSSLFEGKKQKKLGEY